MQPHVLRVQHSYVAKAEVAYVVCTWRLRIVYPEEGGEGEEEEKRRRQRGSRRRRSV